MLQAADSVSASAAVEPLIEGQPVVQEIISQHTEALCAKSPPPGSPDGSESAVLKLKGLPYSATEAQILEFFAGYDIKEVAFVYEPDGRPSGLAFAEFTTREQALQAMSKNGAYIGERYVRLLHVPKQEMQEQVRLGTIAIPGNAHRRSRMQQPQQQPYHHMRGGGLVGGFDLMQAMPPHGVGDQLQLAPHGGALQHATPRMALATMGVGVPMQAYAQPSYQAVPGQLLAQPQAPGGVPGPAMMAVAQVPGHSMGTQLLQLGPGGGMAVQMAPAGGMAQVVTQDARLGPMTVGGGGAIGVQNLQMAAPPHMALAYQLSGMSLGNAPPHIQQTQLQPAPIGPGTIIAAPPMAAAVSPPPPVAPGGYNAALGNAAATTAGASGGGAAAPILVIGTDSKTVKIRGLPFRATPLDIFDFFDGYTHIVESLQLGVDALGRPSGEAWLTFTSSDEALRAVRERNRHYLGNRYLELSLT